MRLRLVPDPPASGGQSPHDAVVAAAWSLFLRHGYTHTTMADIARAAGVPHETVRSEFGNKRQILVAVRDASYAQADLDAQLARVLDEPDAVRRLQLWARCVRSCHEIGSEMSAVIDEAVRADPGVAQMFSALRLVAEDELISILEGIKGQLASGVTVKSATDVLWALIRAPVYRELVQQQRWSPAQYEEWLALSMRQQLLGDQHGASGAR